MTRHQTIFWAISERSAGKLIDFSFINSDFGYEFREKAINLLSASSRSGAQKLSDVESNA